MHLELALTSEDYEQFTDNIISKYQPINNNPNINKAAKIDEQIRDFAKNLCEMYQKFYPIFHKTHYQHGMYLALINSSPSNIQSFHQEYINENHKVFREFDTTQWLHTTSTTFEVLLMNLRKLIIDTSKGKGKAISMKSISQYIKQFHINIKANSDEFSQFEDDLDKQIKIATAPERKEMWDYIISYNIHLEDKFSVNTDDPFHILDLEILMDSLRNFINTIYAFYNYKEPAYIAQTGFQKTQHWIAAFSSFKKYSVRQFSEYITALAQLSNTPKYKNLTPKEASKEIFKKEILENEFEHNYFNIIIEGSLEQRILALREEIESEFDSHGNLSESSEE